MTINSQFLFGLPENTVFAISQEGNFLVSHTKLAIISSTPPTAAITISCCCS